MSALIAVLLLASVCPADPPLPDPSVVLRRYAPVEPYSGHWGVDLSAPVGTPVRSIAEGTVTFAGFVAGMRSVTVDHGGGLRSTYSYLSAVAVGPGTISKGVVLGRSGEDHGIAALHLSIRAGDRYVDPARLLTCGLGPPGDALGLVP
jgi:murein DD-endopeptidase MepM/ murein hydrolase activator NlpD